MSADELAAEPMIPAVETARPKYTKEQEDAVFEWAKKTIIKDAIELNDKRVGVAGITITARPQPNPLPEPFETIRAVWRCIFGGHKR